MVVSALGFKVIKNAIKIRLDRGESLEEILATYPKLSTAQVEEAREMFADYQKEE